MRWSVPLAITDQTLLALGKAREERPRPTVSSIGPDSSAPGTWMAMVALAEFHCNEVLDFLLDVEGSLGPAGYSALLQKARATAFDSWPKRADIMNAVFHLRLGSLASWERFEAAVFVRNSIAHGGGSLTRRQKPTEAGKLKTLGVQLSDRKIVLLKESTAACYEACADFVRDLDRAVRRLPLLQTVGEPGQLLA